ncbi:MAG: hypothetical protein RLZZ413_3055 [Pseudomonadota bacterium]|jgi:predicted DNA-binding WGR domain protein
MVLAHLHRNDLAANMARFYSIYLVPTLFGEVTVLRRWGRIGTCGRMQSETWSGAGEGRLPPIAPFSRSHAAATARLSERNAFYC